MNNLIPKSIALIVAYPGDETLWAGGLMLNHPSWNWFVLCLCQKREADKAASFHHALLQLQATGAMADLDLALEQNPLDTTLLEETILDLLPTQDFDLIITHNPMGEFTSDLSYQEISRMVIFLWESGAISAKQLWTFAYEDGNKAYLPKANALAPIQNYLISEVWLEKYKLITQTYGYLPASWEEQVCPRDEAFWVFNSEHESQQWLRAGGQSYLENLSSKERYNIF